MERWAAAAAFNADALSNPQFNFNPSPLLQACCCRHDVMRNLINGDFRDQTTTRTTTMLSAFALLGDNNINAVHSRADTRSLVSLHRTAGGREQ
jgi:hypothetical protein